MAQEQNLAAVIALQTKLLQSMQEQISKMNTINVPWPTPINIDIDPEDAFKMFQASWNNYCRATQMDEWPADNETRKVGILFNAIGESALKRYCNFGLQQSEVTTASEILKVMESKMVPKKNIIYNRYVFWSTNQEEEPFDLYYSSLIRLVEECSYGHIKEEMLRDRLVLGIKDIKVKKELLKRDNLTLNETVHLCRASEATDLQIKNMSSTLDVKKVKEHFNSQQSKKRQCRYCGSNHIFKKKNCPAWGKTCQHCKGRNHNEKMCKKKNQVRQIKEDKLEGNCESSDNSSSGNTSIINKLTMENQNLATCEVLYQSGTTNKKMWKNVKCLLDTAADESLIGRKNVEKMLGTDYVKKKMRQSKKCLYSFSGHNIMIHGEIDLQLKVKVSGRVLKYQVTFQVVHNDHIPLLSCRACTKMGLIKFCKEVSTSDILSKQTQDIIENYDSVFHGRGSFSGEVDLEVDNSVLPVIQKARRVPVALRPKLKEELKRLEDEGIIVKEESHTKWVSNILIVQTKDSFRICLDPIPLNKAIKRPNYQFTTVDEILPELGKAKIFSTFDVKKGFWHLNLSEESSKLTTFWTPFGKYRWKVLPFGISSSPDYFQIKMSEMIQGLKGVEALVDDILVFGIGDSMSEAILDHNKNLEALMKRLLQFNCKLNKSKMNILQTSVKYYGHIFTNNGLQPDPSKIESIVNIPTPKNKKELQRFLGVVTYLSRFIPNLSSEATYLRKLTHDKTDWFWNETAHKEFENLKLVISDLKTLKYYDKNKPLTIECDSSEGALGVAVFQEDQPVAYASRCLTPTEKKYAQIEKELLAVVFACTRFDQLITGNPKTIIKTDHKPLLSIFKRPLLHAPKRLQSMLLTLQRYSLELQFVSGKENIMADALSRFYLECNDIDQSKNMKIFKLIEQINPIKNIRISDTCLKEIEDMAKKDDNYMKLFQFISQGWPVYLKDVPDAHKPYYSLQGELTTYEGLILKNCAILIPENFRTDMLKKLHKAHSGMENTIKLARDAIFWPSMSKDIKEMIDSCSACNKYQPSQQKLTMQSHRIPEYPFQIVSMDVFFFMKDGKQLKYLITVDHYSDFFEIDKLKDLSARSVVDCCKINFSRHGVPEIIVTDGGTNFVSQEFSDFAKKWNFTQTISSPHYPQGNGKAEATVKIAKKLLLKSFDRSEDFWLNLLCLRNTPNKINSSPVQRLFSRRTRGFLPVIPQLLKPQVVKDVSADIERKRADTKYYHDKRAKEAVKLEIGQPVSVQLHPSVNKSWTPGVITDILSDRSYMVEVNDTSYRRNLSHIRPLSLPFRASPINNCAENIGLPDSSMYNNVTENNNQSIVDTECDHTIHPSGSVEIPSDCQHNILSSPVKNTKENSVTRSPRPKRELRKPLYLKDYVS